MNWIRLAQIDAGWDVVELLVMCTLWKHAGESFWLLGAFAAGFVLNIFIAKKAARQAWHA